MKNLAYYKGKKQDMIVAVRLATTVGHQRENVMALRLAVRKINQIEAKVLV